MVAAAKKYNAPAQLYLSHSTDKLRNPLPYDSKLYWVDRAFGNKVDVVKSEERTVFEILKRLSNEGYTDVIYVGGGDRIGGEGDISQQILRYNGTPGKNGEIPYSFNSIKFVNAGNRNDSSDDLIERASASAARAAVVNGNFEGFRELVPFNERDADSLFRQLYVTMTGGELPENLSEIESSKDISESIIILESLGGQIEIKDQSYPVRNNKDIIMGDQRFIKDFMNVFDGSPISINIPEKNIEIDMTDDYEVVEGEHGSIGARGRLIIYTTVDGKRKKLISLDAKEGNKLGRQSNGEFAESIVCWYYNNGFDKGMPHYNNKLIEVDMGWWKSIQKTVELLNKYWPRTQYIAIQINGNNLDQDIPENYLKYGLIFKSKFLAGKVITGNSKTFKDLYQGGKDNWNKADILLIRKDIKDDLHVIEPYSQDLNDYLISKINSNDFIPVSLKAISDTCYTIDFVVPDIDHIKTRGDIYIQLPSVVKKDDPSGSCYLKDDLIEIQFRSQSGSDNLSVEVQYKLSRGGKGITKIKQSLGLVGNAWYKDIHISSYEDLIDQLSEITNDIRPRVPRINVPDWYNRPCFRGLIGIFDKYRQLNLERGNKVTTESFIKWIYYITTTTPIPFWIIR